MRVPALANWPGKITPGISSDLISTLDIVPTVMNLVDGPAPEKSHGFDQSSLLLNDQEVKKWPFRNYTNI